MSETVTMTGLFLRDRALSLRDDLACPEPPPGEVLIRVTRAGICRTDLELRRGYYPFEGVLGHEFVGVVEAGDDGWTGRRVVGEINAVCGSCAACRSARRSHCLARTVLGIVGRDGAFASYTTLPVENLHAVPDDMPDDVAVFAEPVAAAFRIPEQIALSRETRIAVLGDGKLGLLIAQVLARSSDHVTAFGRHPRKLAILEARGITTGDADEIEPGAFDVVVECTGSASGFAAARAALRAGGTFVMKSTYAGNLEFDASGLVVDEITVVGSRCGPFAPALEALHRGDVDVESLIDDRYPLARALDAFEHAERRGVLKILLDVDS